MPDTKELLVKIQDLRHQLNTLISEKDNLQDSDIIKASKELDTLLSDYEK